MIASLAGLLVAPILIHRRVERLGREIEEVVAPARSRLADHNMALAAEVVALHGYLSTRDAGFLGSYRRAANREAEAAAQVFSVAGRLPGTSGKMADLGRSRAQWKAPINELLAGRLAPERLVALLRGQQHAFADLLGASANLDAAIVRAETSLRTRIRYAERLNTLVTSGLVVLALAGSLTVAWLGRQLRTAGLSLRYRAEEELALREVAHSLNTAHTFEDVARQVAGAAVRTTRASGAYVEQATGSDVIVVAAVGQGPPRTGLRVPYPGSLTEEIIESGDPQVLVDLGAIGRSMGPYLARSCSGCTALVIPLLSEGAVLGTLVLLHPAAPQTFGAREIGHARALADLTTAALRRVLLLEDARRGRTEAEAAVRVRDEVLAIVSHDLRNPLNTVLGGAEMLLGNAAPEQRPMLEILLRSARHMTRLIEDLLDVTRMEAGSALPAEKKPMDLRPVVQEACEGFQQQVAQKALNLTVTVAEGLPLVLADRKRILQVLSNLIGNAVKFTPEGGHITVTAEAENGLVRCAVSDTGPGVPAQDHDRIFDPYWQAIRTARLGTGLGLPITKGIVEAHGGTIGLRSTPGEGSTFFFTLPAVSA